MSYRKAMAFKICRLRSSCVYTASDNDFASRAADMGVAVDCFCLIAVAAC